MPKRRQKITKPKRVGKRVEPARRGKGLRKHFVRGFPLKPKRKRKREGKTFAKEKMMKILVACEESGRVTEAFRNKGHEAFSCDIKPTSGKLPQYHFQENVLNLLKTEKWDMLIAFPPCTYFSKMNFLNYYRKGKFNEERFKKAQDYINLFNTLWNADIEKICIENPVPMKLFDELLPKYTMSLQPYEFGESYSKKTCLWLKNLPPLIPTCLNLNHKPLITTSNSFEIEKTIEKQSERRSKTPISIAEAMAEQWNF